MLGEHRGQEVAVDELAGVVDEEAAVGVAVPGDAEVGALLEHLVDDELAVLLQQRVGLVVGEVAVRRPVGVDEVEAASRSSSGPTIGPAMPLPPSSTTFAGLTSPGR